MHQFHWRRIAYTLLALCCLILIGLSPYLYVVWQYYAAINRLSSVHKPVHYAGDGLFHDAGKSAGIYRFSLSFGDISADGGTYRFDASELPRANFVIFLDIRSDDAWARYDGGHNEWEESFASVTVSADGREVAVAAGKLKNWIVTNAANEGGQFYVMDGNFDASPGTKYQIEAYLEPVGKMPVAKLVMSGGGWKDPATNKLHFPEEY